MGMLRTGPSRPQSLAWELFDVDTNGYEVIDLWLDFVQLHDGNVFAFSPGVTAIVGPNNSGKSQFLRDLHGALSQDAGREHTAPSTFRAVAVRSGIEANAAVGALAADFPVVNNSPYPDHIQLPNGASIQLPRIETVWGDGQTFGEFASYLIQLLTAEQRLTLTQAETAFDTTGLPTSPLQRLFVNRTLEQRVSDVVLRAFGTGVSLHRYRGSVISLHVGHPTAQETIPPQSAEYMREMALLPEVSSQGDGMRCFVGMVLAIVASDHQLILLDEPEAFLHPPQARAFGRFVAEMAGLGKQVVVSTHSVEFIKGLTDQRVAGSTLSIARLTRPEGGHTQLATIPADAVSRLYQDPLLRYTSTLDGLFYHGACVCESEGDCTYFAATLASDRESQPDDPRLHQDIHFSHTNGKARIAQAVGALRSAGLPAMSIVDIDVLQDAGQFSELISAHGGDSSTLEPLRTSIASYIKTLDRPASRADFRRAVEPVAASTETSLSPEESQIVAGAIKRVSGWREFKRAGRALLRGGVVRDFDQMTSSLSELGVFIVKSGELESLHPQVSSENKSSWLAQVLTERLFEMPGEQHDIVSMVSKFAAPLR
jgi:energy-coupling factor transporter ATP-binding protein EcfA2